MGVSKNRGTPKSSILIGFSIINHPFWDTTIFGNTYIQTAQISGLSYIKLGDQGISWLQLWALWAWPPPFGGGTNLGWLDAGSTWKDGSQVDSMNLRVFPHVIG